MPLSDDEPDAEAGPSDADDGAPDSMHDAADALGSEDASAVGEARGDGAPDGADSDAPAPTEAVEAARPDGGADAAIDASDAATLGIDLDAKRDGVVAPRCPINVTDVTAAFDERIVGRVVASASVNPYTKLMTERIGARSARDHLLMFERVAGSWTETDISRGAAEHPRPPDGERCILATAAEVGSFHESNNGPDLIQTWTALSPAAELLLFLQYNGDPWNDCLSVSHNARQLVRSQPETLTDDGMAVVGPDHEALVIRWGGFPWNGGDDWQVRARLGGGFVGGFTTWKYDGMHSFAGPHEDGTISVFRSTALDVWKQDALAPTGPRVADVPVAWTSLRAENLAATSEDQHLLLFSHRPGEDWQTTDVSFLDGETAIGRVARYELPNAFDAEEVLIARNVAGHLVYHYRDRSLQWRAIDLSRESKVATAIVGDPAAWAVPVQAIAAQAADGRLLLFEGLECLRPAPAH